MISTRSKLLSHAPFGSRSLENEPLLSKQTSTTLIGIFSSLTLVVTALALLGYLLSIEALYRPIAGGTATHPMTALVAMLLALRLNLQGRLPQMASIVLPGLALTICLLHLTSPHLLEWITPFQSTVAAELSLGLNNSMGANTALTLSLIAISQLSGSLGRLIFGQATALVALALPTASALGYLYGLSDFHGQMSALTTVIGFLLALASLLQSAHRWIVKSLLSRTAAGQVARLQILASFLVPTLLSYVALSMRESFDERQVVAMSTVGFIWFAAGMICISTLRLNRAELGLERSLRKSAINEKIFRGYFKYSPIPKLVVGPQGMIESANHAAEELLGYPVEGLVGVAIEQLVPEDKRQQHEGMRQAYMSSPEIGGKLMAKNRMIVALRYDGREVPISIALTPVDTSLGKKVIATFVDQTELSQQVQALSRSNEELDRFAYVASHDLRAPLRTIDSMSKFLAEDLEGQLTGESKDHLRLIRNRVHRLDGLLNDLLAYSRIGRKEAEPQWLDPAKAIAENAELYVPTDTFEVHIEGVLPPIFAPKPQFDMVCRNLLMNSVKHHDQEHGTIRVWWEQTPDQINLCFADDGPGIPQEYHEKVFAMFTTLKPRDQVEGSGMGLALLRKSMASQGGSISIDAHTGRGSVFRVTYPIPANHIA